MKRWWVRWLERHEQEFEYHGPWWVSGEAMSGEYVIIVAAVVAENEEAAKRVIRQAHDRPWVRLEWSFVEERPDDWEPFCDRFPRAEWMRWPWPAPDDKEGA